eukprot:6212773-Pleurochrysis_carterae.AAC.1
MTAPEWSAPSAFKAMCKIDSHCCMYLPNEASYSLFLRVDKKSTQFQGWLRSPEITHCVCERRNAKVASRCSTRLDSVVFVSTHSRQQHRSVQRVAYWLLRCEGSQGQV